MKIGWIVIAVAALVAVVAADPAFARAKHKAKAHCVDRPYQFSWSFLFPGQPEPRPNGCSPPVYAIRQVYRPGSRSQHPPSVAARPGTGYSAHAND